MWKEQIQKAKDLYEEAKAASASQIDRFYLSYCGGNGANTTEHANERNVNTTFAVGDQEQDSDQVIGDINSIKTLLSLNFLARLRIMRNDVLCFNSKL